MDDGERHADAPRDDGERPARPFKAGTRRSFVRRTFPIAHRLRRYTRIDMRHDVVAGLTVAALAIPSGMAYAQLSGLSPVVGLYALLLPVVAYAIFGSSRQLIVGPEGVLSLLVVAAVAPLAGHNPTKYAALAAMLAVLVGCIALVARVVRLGWIADYFSRPVLVGYMHGIAVVLIVGQLGKLLGVTVGAGKPIPQLRDLISNIGETSGVTALVGLSSVALLMVLRWRARRVPGSLLVVVGGIVASAAFGLQGHGVATVGHIPSGLPSFMWPGVSGGNVLDLFPAALGIFAVAYADWVLTARSFAGRHQQSVDANQEILALAAANVAAGVTQGYTVGASGSRTTVNDMTGGRTQLVGADGAIVIALVLLFLTQPVSKLPTACLGAVIVSAAAGIVDPREWRALARVGVMEVVIAAVAFTGVVVFGVLEALIVSVVLSIIEVVRRSAKPHDAVLGWVPRMDRYANVSVHPTAKVVPGVVVYRLDDRLFYANVRYVTGRVLEAIHGSATPTRWLVFDAEGVVDIDASGVEALSQLDTTLKSSSITLVVARLKDRVATRLQTSGLTDEIGRDHFYPTVHAAVQACLDADAITTP